MTRRPGGADQTGGALSVACDRIHIDRSRRRMRRHPAARVGDARVHRYPGVSHVTTDGSSAPRARPGSALARLTTVFALTLACAGATTGLLNAPAAQAQTVSDGSLAFSGDAGDYISGGQSYSYATSSGDGLDAYASTDDSHISVSVNGANGDWWYLDLAAPPVRHSRRATTPRPPVTRSTRPPSRAFRWTATAAAATRSPVRSTSPT